MYAVIVCDRKLSFSSARRRLSKVKMGAYRFSQRPFPSGTLWNLLPILQSHFPWHSLPLLRDRLFVVPCQDDLHLLILFPFHLRKITPRGDNLFPCFLRSQSHIHRFVTPGFPRRRMARRTQSVLRQLVEYAARRRRCALRVHVVRRDRRSVHLWVGMLSWHKAECRAEGHVPR